MTRFYISTVIYIAFLIALGGPRPVPGQQPLSPIFAGSDYVCECRVDSVLSELERPVGKIDRDTLVQEHVTVTLRPIKVFKSNSRLSGSIVLKYTEEVQAIAPEAPQLQRNDGALFFLRSTSDQAYDFADRWLGMTVFKALPKSSSGESGLNGLEASLAAITEQGDIHDQLTAYLLLEDFDKLSPSTLARIGSYAKSTYNDSALTCWAILVKNNVPDVVPDLAKYLQIHDGAPVSAWGSLAVGSIMEELGKIRDPRAVKGMEALARSPLVGIRQGAVRSLRGMRIPASAATIVERLDDTDYSVRLDAVLALAEIFNKNGDYRPDMSMFDKNPTKYTALWKKWWAEEGQKLVPPKNPDHSPPN